MSKKLTVLILSALLYLPSQAQDTLIVESQVEKKASKVKLSGYIKDLVTVSIPTWNDQWYFDNLLHNRLNFKWHTSKTITFTMEARNRIFFGNGVQFNPSFEDQVTESLDYWQLDWMVSKNKSYLFYSNIDRANITWRKNRYSLIVGKQRINWGKSYVWNPNDIFNAYSFFDFDYEERRGTDAVLFKYITSPLSSLELASDYSDSFDSLTFAVKYNFNKWEYDFQVLSGKYLIDYFIGMGWAGQINSIGFKGEATYFQPYENNSGDPKIMVDLSFDYTLPNTLFFQLEGIFNSNPNTNSVQDNLLEPVTAKTLTFNKWSVFGSVAYEVTPLVKFSLNGIYYIDDSSYFINPNITFSLNKNTDFLIASQIFNGDKNSTFGNLGSYVFTRLKWSF